MKSLDSGENRAPLHVTDMESSAVDLQLLVRQRPADGEGVRFAFEVKASRPELNLNYRDLGEIVFSQSPAAYLKDLFSEVESLRWLHGDAEAVEDGLERLGLELMQLCATPELLICLISLQDEVKTLQILSDVSWIPWELMKLGRGEPFLGEAFALTRWRRGIRDHRSLPLHSIALVVPEDAGLPRSRDELAYMESLAGRERQVITVDPRRQAVLNALDVGLHDAWHFCGHCSEPRPPFEWRLALDADESLLPADFLGAARFGPLAPLIYFNSCHSAGTVLTPEGQDGWARRLMDGGAGAFLGSLWTTSDQAAFCLAETFYRCFTQGAPLGEAARLAREETRARFPGDPTWLALSAFGHPLATCRRRPRGDAGPETGWSQNEMQEAFALVRSLELETFSAADRIHLSPLQVDRSMSIPTVRLNTAAGTEIWGIVSPGLPLDEILGIFVALEAASKSMARDAGHAEIGICVTAELTDDLSYLSTLLDHCRAHRRLRPDLRHILFREPRSAFLLDRVIRSLVSDAVDEDADEVIERGALNRFRIRGHSPTGLQQTTLALMGRRFDLDLGLASDAELKFDEVAGATLSLLRRRRQGDLAASKLWSRLETSIRRGHPAPGPEQRTRVFDGLLRSQAELLNESIHGRAIRLGKLWVRPRARFLPREDVTDETATPASFVEDVEDWLTGRLMEDLEPMTLIMGDFGHGKTTLLRYLAARLAQRWQPGQAIPVFLRLRDIRPGSDILSIVADQLRPHMRLTDALWREQNWILFCDGFDEMSIAFQDREDWVSLCFAAFVRESSLPNVQVVLSSRPILFLDPMRRSDTVDRFDRLMLSPFNDGQIHQWLSHWSEAETEISFQDLEQQDLVEVARTPVLLMMIAMMYHQVLGHLEKVANRAEVYGRFFDWTAQWGGLREPGTGPKQDVPSNYREILQEIAWLMFSHGRAKSGMLAYEVLKAELESSPVMDQVVIDERMFVAHAFHERKLHHLEFIHQSLREYLVAEKGFQTFCRIADGEPWDWQLPVLRLISNRPLTQAKVGFFRELIEGLEADQALVLAERSQDLYYWPSLLYSLLDQVPHKLADIQEYTFDQGQLAREKNRGFSVSIVTGNIALWAFLFETYLKAGHGLDDPKLPERLKAMCHFLASDPGAMPLMEMLRQALGRMELRDLAFEGMDLSNFQFQDVHWRGCRFHRCQFKETSFERGSMGASDTSRMIFEHCEIRSPRRFNAVFDGVDFNHCYVELLQAQSGIRTNDVVWRRCHFFQCGLAHFYRQGHFIECFFEDIRPLPEVLPGPETTESVFEKCLVYRPGVGWQPVREISDLIVQTGGEAPDLSGDTK